MQSSLEDASERVFDFGHRLIPHHCLLLRLCARGVFDALGNLVLRTHHVGAHVVHVGVERGAFECTGENSGVGVQQALLNTPTTRLVHARAHAQDTQSRDTERLAGVELRVQG